MIISKCKISAGKYSKYVLVIKSPRYKTPPMASRVMMSGKEVRKVT